MDLLYMARTLREALALEKILDRAGVEYLVETGTYSAGVLFRRNLTGAFFYVIPADREAARGLLAANSYRPFGE